MTIVHVGFPKVASTYLQKEVLPKLADLLNYKYFESNKDLKEKFSQLIYSNKLNIKITKKNIPTYSLKKYFFSSEDLINVNSFENDLFFDNLYRFLKKDKNVIILLCIRDPISWCKSLYGEFQFTYNLHLPPEFIFVGKKEYSNKIPFQVNIDNFSYNKILLNLRKKFKNIIIVKYEDIIDYSWINKIIKIKKIKKNFEFSKKKIRVTKFKSKSSNFLSSFYEYDKKFLFYVLEFFFFINLNVYKKLENYKKIRRVYSILILITFFNNIKKYFFIILTNFFGKKINFDTMIRTNNKKIKFLQNEYRKIK